MSLVRRISLLIILTILFAAVFIPVANISYADGDTYSVSVYCLHAKYEIEKHLYNAGDIVEIKIGKVSDGYVLDEVLASCGDAIVPVKTVGDVASFVMPAGDVEVRVLFVDSSDVKKTLSTKEIIAICVTGAVVLGAVGYFIYWKVKKKKKA